MEKVEKEEDLEEDLDVLRDYGFNVDHLMDLLQEENNDDKNDQGILILYVKNDISIIVEEVIK